MKSQGNENCEDGGVFKIGILSRKFMLFDLGWN
jgi:hypothetical protein